MGTFIGNIQDPVAGRPGDQMLRRFGDIRGTSVVHFFLNPTQKHIKHFSQFSQSFIVNCSSEKLNEQYSYYRNNF